MGCSVLDQRSRQELEAAYGPNPPGWQAAYAVDAISPGRIWHIYLKGADPDGDLRFVHVWLNTSGRSSSPIRLPVDPDQNLSLSGYLILETSLLWDPGRDLFGRWLSLWVTLEDRADHRSEPREFPLRFYYGAPPGGPPPGVFEERFLGRIPLELIPRDDLDEDFHHFPYRRWR